MDVSISLKRNEVEAFFKKSLKEFDESVTLNKEGNYVFKNSLTKFDESVTPNEKSKYVFNLSDIPKIKKIDSFGFTCVRHYFIEAIQDKKYQLSDFLEVFKLGIDLYDSSDRGSFKKSGGKYELEDYFKYKILTFFKLVYPFVKIDAYINSKEHTDTILYNPSNYKDYVVIEYAANIQVGTVTNSIKDETIFGHLNRVILDYSQMEIIFNHDSTKIPTKKYNINQSWFIYFGYKLNSNDLISTLLKEYNEKYMNEIFQIHYQKNIPLLLKGFINMNIILISYDFDTNHVSIHWKKYGQVKFHELQ